TRLQVRTGHHLTSGGVDHGEDGDEALLTKDAAVLQLGIGHPTHRVPVHVDVPARHRPGDPGLAVDQVDHHTVLGEHHPLRGDPGLDCETAVGHQVPDLPVHRHHVPRPDDVVHVQQLTGGGVPGDVHACVGLVDH